MKKMRNLEWGEYRHPELIQSLTISVNELKFIRLFLKRGFMAMVNELHRERKTKQESPSRNDFPSRFRERERIEA